MTLKTGPADDDAYGVASRCAVAVRRPHGDDGLFLIGFMFRVLIGLSILGIVGFDAASVIMTRNHLEETAVLAADQAARTYHAHPDSKAAYLAAASVAEAGGATLAPADFAVTKNGTVTLTVRDNATTLVLGHLPGTADLTQPSSTVVRTARA